MWKESSNDQEEAREIFVQLPMETSVTLVITKCPIIASVNHIKAPDPFAMRLIELWTFRNLQECKVEESVPRTAPPGELFPLVITLFIPHLKTSNWTKADNIFLNSFDYLPCYIYSQNISVCSLGCVPSLSRDLSMFVQWMTFSKRV